jgi:CheY-like chemotaxis protein
VTILIVEDETLTRLMLIGELETRGHTVVEAADADEALLVLRTDQSIRLLFTDMKMPGTISGLELVRIARAEYPAVKVVIGSAHVGLSDWASEADAAFEKPYELKQVVAKIVELIRPHLDRSLRHGSDRIKRKPSNSSALVLNSFARRRNSSLA